MDNIPVYVCLPNEESLRQPWPEISVSSLNVFVSSDGFFRLHKQCGHRAAYAD